MLPASVLEACALCRGESAQTLADGMERATIAIYATAVGREGVTHKAIYIINIPDSIAVDKFQKFVKGLVVVANILGGVVGADNMPTVLAIDDNAIGVQVVDANALLTKMFFKTLHARDEITA